MRFQMWRRLRDRDYVSRRRRTERWQLSRGLCDRLRLNAQVRIELFVNLRESCRVRMHRGIVPRFAPGRRVVLILVALDALNGPLPRLVDGRIPAHCFLCFRHIHRFLLLLAIRRVVL